MLTGGIISMTRNTRSSYQPLQTQFIKRMRQRWQFSATYTLSGLWDAQNQPFQGLEIVAFRVAPDLGNEFTLASSDQRHRAVFNGSAYATLPRSECQ